MIQFLLFLLLSYLNVDMLTSHEAENYCNDELLVRSFCSPKAKRDLREGRRAHAALITTWINPRIRRYLTRGCCIDYTVIRGCHEQ